MRNRKNDKVIKYPKQYHFSIGFIVIGVMFIYMLYHLFTFVTADNITIYEVSQGSISSNLEYNALAIRKEQVITADSNGDVLYLAENFGKVGAKTLAEVRHAMRIDYFDDKELIAEQAKRFAEQNK